ncbi:hypothetical protein [Thermoflexus sp.]|uniref:hypothetical protein n=1 Tax=Thermoflexus sp. TaxID=1969742 RepID=UPI0035E4005F
MRWIFGLWFGLWGLLLIGCVSGRSTGSPIISPTPLMETQIVALTATGAPNPSPTVTLSPASTFAPTATGTPTPRPRAALYNFVLPG